VFPFFVFSHETNDELYVDVIEYEKKAREREREEEHWRFEEEKRNEREKRDGTTEEKKDFALHGFRTLDDVPEWYRAPRDVAVVLEL